MTTTAIERAQQQVATDRTKIDETKAELRQLVHERVDQAKSAVDPRTYIREYPLIALGLLFGAGVALAMTGADRAAADGVVDAKDFVVDKIKGDEPDPLIAADGGAEHPIERHASIGDRVLGTIDVMLYRTFKPVLDDMRRTVDNVPRDGASM